VAQTLVSLSIFFSCNSFIFVLRLTARCSPVFTSGVQPVKTTPASVWRIRPVCWRGRRCVCMKGCVRSAQRFYQSPDTQRPSTFITSKQGRKWHTQRWWVHAWHRILNTHTHTHKLTQALSLFTLRHQWVWIPGTEEPLSTFPLSQFARPPQIKHKLFPPLDPILNSTNISREVVFRAHIHNKMHKHKPLNISLAWTSLNSDHTHSHTHTRARAHTIEQ